MRWLPRLLTVGALGAAAVVVGHVEAGASDTQPAADAQPSIVETYDYPNAAYWEQQRHIKLLKGDGHILFVDCAGATDLVHVQSSTGGTHVGDDFCFRITGPVGYVTMQLTDSYLITNGSKYPLTATVSPGDGKAVPVPPSHLQWTPLTNKTTGDPQTLVELRTA